LGDYHYYNNGKGYSEKFNLELKNKLFVNFDEGFGSKSKEAEAKLKSFITQPTMKLEGKGINPTNVLNPARSVFTTNSNWAVKMDDDDRRFAVFTTIKKDFVTPEYFDGLSDAINNGDLLEKFMHELQNRKITSRLNRPPMTKTKQTQKAFSANKVSEWFDFVMETRKCYDIKLKKDTVSFEDYLWNDWTDDERTMNKENAFESFSDFKGSNDHIDTTNKLFSALDAYLANNDEWGISNEAKRLKGGFNLEKKVQRMWVLKRKVTQG